MKNLFTLLLLLLGTSIFSQTKDYNIKKGAVIKGYDVVSYFDGKPLKGDKKISTEYDGATFRFANRENLEKFKANPKKFVPQYGGWCAYAIGAANKKYGVNPETYEIRDGKLYLFYNSLGTNTFKKWQEEGAEKLQKQADKNWASYTK